MTERFPQAERLKGTHFTLFGDTQPCPARLASGRSFGRPVLTDERQVRKISHEGPIAAGMLTVAFKVLGEFVFPSSLNEV